MSNSERIREGIGFCRKGHWEHGVKLLLEVTDGRDTSQKLPSLYYSYLGYGIARCQNRVREGIALCERALKLGFYDSENYYNMARVQLLRGSRRKANHALKRGLTIDPEHRGMKDLKKKMGSRRPPVFPFLSRNNPINKYLGILRHQLLYKKAA